MHAIGHSFLVWWKELPPTHTLSPPSLFPHFIPMRASCPSAECSALLQSSWGQGRRIPYASATGARSPKKRYMVAANICVAIVTKQPHSARRWCAPISLAHGHKNFASIFMPRKVRWKLLRRKLLHCTLLSSCPDVCFRAPYPAAELSIEQIVHR